MEKVDWIVGLSGEKLGQKRDQKKKLLSSFVTLDSAFKLPHKVFMSNDTSLQGEYQ